MTNLIGNSAKNENWKTRRYKIIVKEESKNVLQVRNAVVLPPLVETILKRETKRLARLVNSVDSDTVTLQQLCLIWGNSEPLSYKKALDIVSAMELAKMMEKHFTHRKREYIINRAKILEFLGG